LLNKGARRPDSASAANGRTHGLSASKWLRDDERERLAERTAELEDELMPTGTAQRAVVAEIAAAVVRIESCDLDEENWRFHRAQRAEYYWEEDRQAEAEALMAKLHNNPSVYVRKLRQTLQGARRLRRAFAALAALVDGGPTGEPARPLDVVSRERGFDLLGLEPEERQGVTPLDLPADRAGDDDDAALAAHQATVLAVQLAELDRLTSERYVELDEKMRLEAMLGNSPGIDNQTRLIRRYRCEAQRRRDLGLKKLEQLQDEADDDDREYHAWEDARHSFSDASSRLRMGRPPTGGEGESTEAPPVSQSPQKTAEQPAPAAGAEPPANPPAEGPSPRPGQPDGAERVSIRPGPQPPRAESYVQKAAHRTLQ
jgi:hypothetical protein